MSPLDLHNIKIRGQVGDITATSGRELLIQSGFRFPWSEDVLIPRITALGCRELLRALPRLPGHDGEHSPITLDLNGQAVVRSKGDDQTSATELVLARSGVSGRGVRFVTNRTYFARALQLGFREFDIANADKPVLCQDGTRKYLWMILGKDGAIQPGSDAVRVSSNGSESAAVPASGNGDGAIPYGRASFDTLPGEAPVARAVTEECRPIV